MGVTNTRIIEDLKENIGDAVNKLLEGVDKPCLSFTIEKEVPENTKNADVYLRCSTPKEQYSKECKDCIYNGKGIQIAERRHYNTMRMV